MIVRKNLFVGCISFFFRIHMIPAKHKLILIGVLVTVSLPLASACTFIVVDPFYSSQLSILNENQASFKLLDTGQASSSENYGGNTVYLDFKKNQASFEPFPVSNGSKWFTDINLPDDWYQDDDGIVLKEHLLGNTALIEVYNGSLWLYNISVPQDIADPFFISFYYPLDHYVYVFSDWGTGLVLNLSNLQISNFTSSNYYGELSQQSLPSLNYGLIRVNSNSGNCENYRYYLPSPNGFKLVAIDDIFHRFAIDPSSSSIYRIDLYISNQVSVSEINYITLEKDSWSFTLSSLPLPSSSSSSSVQLPIPMVGAFIALLVGVTLRRDRELK